MTREQAVRLLRDEPVRVAHSIGFTKLTELNNEWIKKMVSSKTDSTLQASRGTYKTTCNSLALANIILLLPLKRSLFMRKSDTDVKEILRQTQNILRTEQYNALSMVIHGKRIQFTKESATEISTNLTSDIKGTSQLVGMGLGSSLTGKHFDYIFTDDIVNIKDRLSKAERDRTKIVYQELQNVKNRDGKIFNTGTPWHKDDCFSIMPEAEKYNCYHEEVKKIISQDELEVLKANMLPSLFAANYELRHIASEDVIFTDPLTGADRALVEQGTAQLDAAFYGEDYTAFSICKKHGDKYYVLGKCWRKHVEDCYPTIQGLYNDYMCGKMHIEKNADKGLVARDLKNLGLRVNAYHESENKYIKIVTRLKKAWPDIIFVEGTDPEYIEQICDYNENAPHDDCPDSLASLVRVVYNKDDDYVPLWN